MASIADLDWISLDYLSQTPAERRKTANMMKHINEAMVVTTVVSLVILLTIGIIKGWF